MLSEHCKNPNAAGQVVWVAARQGSCGVSRSRAACSTQFSRTVRSAGQGSARLLGPCSDPVRDESAGRALLQPMRSAPRSGLIVRRQEPARMGTATMKLTTVTNVSVDGVTQGLGGPDEDRRGGFERGGWALPLFDNEAATFLYEVYQRADAFLFGRRTYEIFAGYWGVRADSGTIAAALNTRPKYVASTTLTDPQWADTTVLS